MRGRAHESVKECPPEKTPQNQLFLTTFYFVKKSTKSGRSFIFFVSVKEESVCEIKVVVR